MFRVSDTEPSMGRFVGPVVEPVMEKGKPRERPFQVVLTFTLRSTEGGSPYTLAQW